MKISKFIVTASSTISSSSVGNDIRYTKCQADKIREKYKIKIPSSVINNDIQCQNESERGIDGHVLQEGIPELWTNHIENGFYIIPFYFESEVGNGKSH